MIKEEVFNYLKKNGPSTILDIKSGIESNASESDIIHEINELVKEERIKPLTLQDNIAFDFSDSQLRLMIDVLP